MLAMLAACGGEHERAAMTPDAGHAHAEAKDSGENQAAESLHGMRYCEVLAVFVDGGSVEAQVWGTQGLNLCPQQAWNELDAATLRDELGAARVLLNGPRHFLVDAVLADMLPDVPHKMFGGLEMRQLATVQIDAMTEMAAYVERRVNRTTVFTFRSGQTVYELVTSDGTVYVMQSYALIVDPALNEASLASLGERLEPPTGWQYRVRVLDADLQVHADGVAVVVQDELQNTYQLEQ